MTSLVVADDTPTATSPALGPNLYWPGNFDRHLLGGIYSSNINVKIAEGVNHAPGGLGAWELAPGYQHLELLVTGHQRYRLSFVAKSPAALTLELKVISPGEPDQTGKPKPKETVMPVAIAASEAWQPYTLEFQTAEPYPGPHITEILLACYNGANGSAFIDDLSIRRYHTAQREQPKQPVAVLHHGDFEQPDGWHPAGSPDAPLPASALRTVQTKDSQSRVLVLGETAADGPPAAVAQVFNAKPIAGKQVNISADVAYLTHDMPMQAWAGVLMVLDLGSDDASAVLLPTPNPFWLPLGQAAPAGEFKTITATYDVPADVEKLRLRVQVLPGMGSNLAAVDNVRVTPATKK